MSFQSTDSLKFNEMPSTRYLGSKRKLLPVLQEVFSTLEFDSVADPFCGSGAVSYLLKCMGKSVTAADAMQCNVICTRALLGNDPLALDEKLLELFADMNSETLLPGFVATHFDNLFFTADENCFIDGFVEAVSHWSAPYKDAALFVLFQAALAKRPYNLFHRANLYMRTQDVKRSFGNKTTWETPFQTLMVRYAKELQAARFDSGKPFAVHREKVEDAKWTGTDLVYFDPPYVSQKGAGVDYLDYYHLLEGIALQNNGKWEEQLLTRYKHKPLVGRGENPWCDKERIGNSFESIIKRCGSAKIVISYRNDGVPSVDVLVQMLKEHGKKVEVIDCGTYVYALSKNNKSKEMILVGR